MKRKILSINEIKDEVKIILDQGHKRILMLMGEHPGRCAFDYFLEAIQAVYSVQEREQLHSKDQCRDRAADLR